MVGDLMKSILEKQMDAHWCHISERRAAHHFYLLTLRSVAKGAESRVYLAAFLKSIFIFIYK